MKDKLHLPLIPKGKTIKNIRKRLNKAAKKDPVAKGLLEGKRKNLLKSKRRVARKAANKSIRRNR